MNYKFKNQLSQFDIGRVRSNDSTVNKPNQPADKNQISTDILDKKISEDNSVRFSSHASKRLVERNMQVGKINFRDLKMRCRALKKKVLNQVCFLWMRWPLW